VAVGLLATSTLGVAAIAAGASLLGGILGAVAGGIADYRLERRRERSKARAGARLARADLLTAAVFFQGTIERTRWLKIIDLPIDAWDEYRDAIATAIDAEAWNKVAHAFRMIRQAKVGHSIENLPVGPDFIPALRTMYRRCMEGYNALARIAEDADTRDVELSLGKGLAEPDAEPSAIDG
jgi:hypothetical protein